MTEKKQIEILPSDQIELVVGGADVAPADLWWEGWPFMPRPPWIDPNQPPSDGG